MDKAVFWLGVAAFAVAVGALPFVIGLAHLDLNVTVNALLAEPAIAWLGGWSLVALLTFMRALVLNFAHGHADSHVRQVRPEAEQTEDTGTTLHVDRVERLLPGTTLTFRVGHSDRIIQPSAVIHTVERSFTADAVIAQGPEFIQVPAGTSEAFAQAGAAIGTGRAHDASIKAGDRFTFKVDQLRKRGPGGLIDAGDDANVQGSDWDLADDSENHQS